LLALGRETQLEMAYEGGREALHGAMGGEAPVVVLTPEQIEEDSYQPSDNVASQGLEDSVDA